MKSKTKNQTQKLLKKLPNFGSQNFVETKFVESAGKIEMHFMGKYEKLWKKFNISRKKYKLILSTFAPYL